MEQNRAKINSAFASAIANAKVVIEKGMEDLLEAGMMFCLEAHDTEHQKHLEIGDSYGWVLLHDGNVVKSRIYAEGGEGNIREAFIRIAEKHGGSGYRGFVIAGMKPANYFSVSYEVKFVRRGISELKSEDFNKYFKPIKG